jgi:hypothetical protein
MSILSTVITGTKIKPPRVLIYGPSGVGKTTWAAGAPAPILVPTEDGRGALDIPALPVAQSYIEVHNAITALYEEDHAYRTVIIDSLDHLEPLIWKGTRGVGDGERILLTEERPSHVAKNRWSLPYELPLQFSAFSASLKQSTTKPVNTGTDKE